MCEVHPLGRIPFGEVHEGLPCVGGTPHWNRERVWKILLWGGSGRGSVTTAPILLPTMHLVWGEGREMGNEVEPGKKCVRDFFFQLTCHKHLLDTVQSKTKIRVGHIIINYFQLYQFCLIYKCSKKSVVNYCLCILWGCSYTSLAILSEGLIALQMQTWARNCCKIMHWICVGIYVEKRNVALEWFCNQMLIFLLKNK